MRKPCCDKQGTKREAWSRQEDQKLIDYIRIHGEGCWHSIPKVAGLHRCGKSCRLRWINYLRPDIKRGNFAQDEEELIIKLHALLGNRWALIAGRLPGRTDNEVKNYWNSQLRKKLLNMGIDPNNHKVNQVPSAQQPQNVATVVASLNNDDDTCKPKAPNPGDNNGRAYSDAGSCLEDETPAGSYNLNLDLTIAIPSPPVTLIDEDQTPQNTVSDMTSEYKSGELTTPLLFR